MNYRNPYRPLDLGGARRPRPARKPDQRTLLRRHLSERLALLRELDQQPCGNSGDVERWKDASARLQELGLLCTALGLDPDSL